MAVSLPPDAPAGGEDAAGARRSAVLRRAAQRRTTPAQTYSLTPEQVAMLPEETACNGLGVAEPLAVAGAQLHSPALAGFPNAGMTRPLAEQFVIMNTISTLTAADLATAFNIKPAFTLPAIRAIATLTWLSADGEIGGVRHHADHCWTSHALQHRHSSTSAGLAACCSNALIEQLKPRCGYGSPCNQAAIALQYERSRFSTVTVRRNYYPSAHGREGTRSVMALPLVQSAQPEKALIAHRIAANLRKMPGCYLYSPLLPGAAIGAF